jgi:group II intron reverse transcriptase/maturase
MRKAHSLIDKVYDPNNLHKAWRRVRRNRGAAGVDQVTIPMFESDLEHNLRTIERRLRERRYKPQPVRRVYIPKGPQPGKLRPLGIPTVKDRIVQQAILQVVEPLFDHTMSDRSFGYRKGRNAHDAITALMYDVMDGYRHVVDADIKSFFDSIDHNVVMSRVRARIADGRVLDLLEAFLVAGVMENGKVTVPSAGTPQGGVVSAWMSNLVLDDLDRALDGAGFRHVRYADDFVVLCKSREDARDALSLVKEVLDSLKLQLHETKTRLSDAWSGFEFLGFRIKANHVSASSRAIEKFKERIRELTRRKQGKNVEAVLHRLNPVIRGWVGYYGPAEVARMLLRLDQWIRMRIRSFRLKRKKRHDNHRLPNRRLRRWGLLSLPKCRPVKRFPTFVGSGRTRARPGSL